MEFWFIKKEIIPEEVMDTGLDVTSKGKSWWQFRPCSIGMDWTLGKRILAKIQSLQCSLDQKSLDLVIPRRPLAQCPKGWSHGCVENPRTGFHCSIFPLEKREKLWNTSRNGAAGRSLRSWIWGLFPHSTIVPQIPECCWPRCWNFGGGIGWCGIFGNKHPISAICLEKKKPRK